MKSVIVVLFCALMAAGAFVTTYGVAVYLYSGEQQGHQQVTGAVVVGASTFHLPSAYVSAATNATTTEKPTLTVVTYVPNLRLNLSCINNATLAQNYTILNLNVRNMSTNALLGTLNLLSNNTLQLSLPSTGTYYYNYEFNYTASVLSADNLIRLQVLIASLP